MNFPSILTLVFFEALYFKPSFLRVHQSFLVNYKHVDGLAYNFVIMDNGKKISISEDRRKVISEQYCSMEDTFYVAE